MEGHFIVKKSGCIAAYARITKAGCYLTPVKLTGAELNAIHAALGEGTVPEGYTLTENTKVSQPEYRRAKPNWGEMSVSSWKRQAWLKRKQEKSASSS